MSKFERFTWLSFFFVCGMCIGTYGLGPGLLLLMIVALFILRNRLDTITIAKVLSELLEALYERSKVRVRYDEDAEEVMEKEAERWRRDEEVGGGDIHGPDGVTDDAIVAWDDPKESHAGLWRCPGCGHEMTNEIYKNANIVDRCAECGATSLAFFVPVIFQVSKNGGK